MDNDNVGARFPTPTQDLAALLAKWSGYRGLFDWFIDSFLDEGDTSDPEEVKRYKRQKGTVKALSTLLVVGLWAAVLVFAADLVWGDKNDDGSAQMGPFGDFFAGVVNPIFTFLTFFGLVVTIVLQRVELGLTRKELATSSAALTAQVLVSEQQRFDSTFFKLLDRFEKHQDDISTKIVDPYALFSDDGFLYYKYFHEDFNGDKVTVEDAVYKIITSHGGLYSSYHLQNIETIYECVCNIMEFNAVRFYVESYVSVVDYLMKGGCPVWAGSAVSGVISNKSRVFLAVLYFLSLRNKEFYKKHHSDECFPLNKIGPLVFPKVFDYVFLKKIDVEEEDEDFFTFLALSLKNAEPSGFGDGAETVFLLYDWLKSAYSEPAQNNSISEEE